jgi:hypothetical protein
VETAEIAIAGQAGTLTEAAGLAREEGRLSAAMARQGTRQRDNSCRHPRRPVWAAMKGPEHAEALRDMARWVSAILLRRYPVTGTILPPATAQETP